MRKASLRRDSPRSPKVDSSLDFRDFAERPFFHAKLAAAASLSVESGYEAKILRCPRLHSSL
jgi:hypothetical protein